MLGVDRLLLVPRFDFEGGVCMLLIVDSDRSLSRASGTQMYDSYTYFPARRTSRRLGREVANGTFGVRMRAVQVHRAHRRRPARRGGRAVGRRVPRRGARARSSSPSTTSACRARPGDMVADELRAAAARGVAVRLLYNVDSARPPAIHPPPSDPARAPARAADRRRGGARDPRPDAPQVRGPRPRGGLDRLGELDGRLVDAAGERLRRRSTRQPLAAAYAAQLRGALGAPRRRALRPDRAAPVELERRGRGARLVHARARRRALAGDRDGDRRRAPAGADRLAGDHLGADPRRRSPSSAPAAASTSPG